MITDEKWLDITIVIPAVKQSVGNTSLALFSQTKKKLRPTKKRLLWLKYVILYLELGIFINF